MSAAIFFTKNIRQRCFLYLVCIMCLGLCINCFTPFAYAKDSESENAVNVQQLPDSSFIYDTSIVDLASADAHYDNQTVQVTGEVVGDNIKEDPSGRYRWITLASLDDSASVAVYMTEEAAAKIDTFGAYGARGTTLQVRGKFHLTCPEHEGLSDLHADVVTVVKPGKTLDNPFEFRLFIPGIITVSIGLIMGGVFYWLRERQR